MKGMEMTNWINLSSSFWLINERFPNASEGNADKAKLELPAERK